MRPTHNRIRETLFNWLSTEIPQSLCLDLFAGSGALGFEALSRGAKNVVFVDRSREVVQAIQANLIQLQASGACNSFKRSVCKKLIRSRKFRHCFFLDPPFGAGTFLPTLTWLKKSQLIDCQTIVYFELPLADQCFLERVGLLVIKQKQTRSISYGLLRVGDQFFDSTRCQYCWQQGRCLR